MPRTAFGGTSDNTRVDKRYYERPSIPQSAPLSFAPLHPPDLFQTEFSAALVQLSNSFRSFQPPDKFPRLSLPQQAPLSVEPLGLFIPIRSGAITQLSTSYRLRSSLPIDQFIRTDFANAPPLYTVATTVIPPTSVRTSYGGTSDSTRVDRKFFPRPSIPQEASLFTVPLNPPDLSQTEFGPARQQQSNSFRSFESLPRDKFERTDFPQSAPLSVVELGLADIFQIEFCPALEQSRSFRTRESIVPVYDYYISRRGAAIIFLEPKHIISAIDQQSGSFYSGLIQRGEEYRRTDFPQSAPILKRLVIDLFQTEFWPAIEQWRSFRTSEIDRVVREYRRTDFPQSAPLLTAQLSLPQDLFQPEFWPALEQWRSFRTNEIDRVVREHRRTDFSQLAPTFVVPTGLADIFQVEFWSAIAELPSFRTNEIDRVLREYRRTDFLQSTPLLTIPLDLSRDQFQAEFWPAIEQWRSFRTDEIDRVLREHRRTDFPQSAPLSAVELLLTDRFQVEFWSAIEQSLRSFRAKDVEPIIPRLRPEYINTIQDGWIQAASFVPGAGGLGSNQYRDSRRR